jgi:alkylation response protein AidB-like acyl-CoA dehydrogenase
MGACALLPRVIGQGRAAELLYTGRSMSGAEGERWGFFNRLCTRRATCSKRQRAGPQPGPRPTFAHGMTKKMLQQEWNMGVDEAIEAEAQAQAICMATNDFHRAYHAFVAKQKPASKETDVADKAYLDWPFFEPRHRRWNASSIPGPPQTFMHAHGAMSMPPAARWCAAGRGGWLRHAVGGAQYGGATDALDTRAMCLIRETLARHEGLADFAFAMQGLGSGAISLFGSASSRRSYLPRVARGEAIAAFALSEPQAGSDVAAMQCAAVRDGDATCSMAKRPGSRTAASPTSTSCLPAPAKRRARAASAPSSSMPTPGLEIAERIDVIAPHPLARLRFEGCRIPAHAAASARPGRASRWRWHAGRVPHLGGRGGAGLCAPRAR